MTITGSDLARDALTSLQSARIAQTEDITDATPRVQPFLDDLARRQITATLTASNLPSPLYPDLIRAFAEHLAPQFGGRPTNGNDLLAIEARLRELTRLDTTTGGLTLKVLQQLEAWKAGSNAMDAAAVTAAIPDILNDLSIRNVIYVPSVDDIPDGASLALTQFIAACLSSPPQIEMQKQMETRLRSLRGVRSFAPVHACYF